MYDCINNLIDHGDHRGRHDSDDRRWKALETASRERRQSQATAPDLPGRLARTRRRKPPLPGETRCTPSYVNSYWPRPNCCPCVAGQVRLRIMNSSSSSSVGESFESPAITETDEIVLAMQPTERDAGGEKVAGLHELPGMLLEHAWVLTNQHGYEDGLQLRFIDPTSRQIQARQFEVAGSLIAIRYVQSSV